MLAVLGMPDLSAAEKNVLAALAWYDGPGGCYPSMKTIAYDTNLNRVTVNKHIQNIKKKGRLIIKSDQRPNRYKIIYDSDSVTPVATLIEPEQAAFDPDSETPVATDSETPVATRTRRTRRTRRTGIREEQENPGYQERNVSTAKTRSNGNLVGYREELLEDGTKIDVPVYES